MGKFLSALLIFSLLFFRTIPAIAADDLQEILESLADLEEREAALEMEKAAETAEFEAFKTAYATIFHTHEEDLQSFLWRITGDEEIDIYSYPDLAKSQVDRIVEKIQSVLDMYPERFQIKIYVHPRYDRGPVAFYSYRARSITTYADRVTERAFAHEVAHAIIHSYFEILPPKKIREMLAQYADQHLWND